MEELKYPRLWSCLRTINLASTIGIAVCSMFLIAFGAEMYHVVAKYKQFFDITYISLIIALIVDGIGLLISAIIGFCGIIKYKFVAVGLSSVLLTLLLILNVSILVTGAIIKYDVEESIGGQMLEFISGYEGDEHIKHAWDSIQESLVCCGAFYPDDWTKLDGDVLPGEYVEFEGRVIKLPSSCCINYYCANGGGSLTGCVRPATDYVTKCFLVIIYVPIAITLLQVISIIVSSIMTVRLKNISTEDTLHLINP